MLNALTDVFAVLIISQCASDITHRMEIVSLNVRLVHRFQHVVDFSFIAQCHDLQHIVMMVKLNYHLI